MLRSPVRGAHSHVIILWPNMSIPGQDCQPQDLQTWSMKAAAQTDDSDQCPRSVT